MQARKEIVDDCVADEAGVAGSSMDGNGDTRRWERCESGLSSMGAAASRSLFIASSADPGSGWKSSLGRGDAAKGGRPGKAATSSLGNAAAQPQQESSSPAEQSYEDGRVCARSAASSTNANVSRLLGATVGAEFDNRTGRKTCLGGLCLSLGSLCLERLSARRPALESFGRALGVRAGTAVTSHTSLTIASSADGASLSFVLLLAPAGSSALMAETSDDEAPKAIAFSPSAGPCTTAASCTPTTPSDVPSFSLSPSQLQVSTQSVPSCLTSGLTRQPTSRQHVSLSDPAFRILNACNSTSLLSASISAHACLLLASAFSTICSSESTSRWCAASIDFFSSRSASFRSLSRTRACSKLTSATFGAVEAATPCASALATSPKSSHGMEVPHAGGQNKSIVASRAVCAAWAAPRPFLSVSPQSCTNSTTASMRAWSASRANDECRARHASSKSSPTHAPPGATGACTRISSAPSSGPACTSLTRGGISPTPQAPRDRILAAGWQFAA
mmetsp:Transcript_54370/g.151459  ORF Transcript_54370/g.151459 Transcript_54370/m.151459 type:complete len:505 (-) Transcript_54370:67-1581(-)